MSAAERMLQEYHAQYREKEEKLRKLEDEISVIKHCLSWINSEATEETVTIESNVKDSQCEVPAVLHSKPEDTDDFIETADLVLHDAVDPSEKRSRNPDTLRKALCGKPTIGKLLNGLLDHCGFSVVDLAKEAEIPQRRLQDFLSDQNAPNSRTIERLAVVFEVYAESVKNPKKKLMEAAERTRRLNGSERKRA